MGQKVNPIGMRLGILEDWRSRWFADKKLFGQYLIEDHKIRRHIKSNYFFAGIPKIEIERTGEEVKISLHTARPGMIIGRRGAEVDRLRGEIEALTGRVVGINIREVTDPEFNAQLVAEMIAEQLTKRAPVRRTVKKLMESAQQRGVRGIKVVARGRLGGSEMSRVERQVYGSIPLHTLRADIDYGFAEAHTTYGQIGVKVWIYKGKVSEGGTEHASDAKTD